jgi:hypothetical protein
VIRTLKIKLISGRYAEEPWEGLMEIDSSSTLENLHLAIQKAVNFDNDHLYDFYIARTARSRNRIRFDDENGKSYSTAIEELFPLGTGNKLFYLFDYGDSWLFQISDGRKKPQEPKKDIKYPRLISESGDKPEQYPSWEE